MTVRENRRRLTRLANSLRRDRGRRIRWMWLLCVARGCPTDRCTWCVRHVGWCPHKIKVGWDPQARQLVAVVANVKAPPGTEQTVRVEPGLAAVAELAAWLSGISELGWSVRLRLFWRAYRTLHPAASPAEIWALWRRAERRRSFVRRDMEWAAWVRSGPPWAEERPPTRT
jgi:hypothetical protein